MQKNLQTYNIAGPPVLMDWHTNCYSIYCSININIYQEKWKFFLQNFLTGFQTKCVNLKRNCLGFFFGIYKRLTEDFPYQ